jgi:hypothetical protein
MTLPYHLAVISARRPHSVPAMNQLLPIGACWYVPEDEMQAYKDAGANRVRAANALVEARNLALDDAFSTDQLCVQTSDDLTKIRRLGVKEHPELTMHETIEEMMSAMAQTGAHLVGCAPTANPFYGKHSINTTGFVVGDLIMIAPTPLRFDANLTLKEDYDYTCQHLHAYGTIARCDYLLATYKHRTNEGGAVTYRNEQQERLAIAYLNAKWPNTFKPNPKRPNEILMRWKPPATKPKP